MKTERLRAKLESGAEVIVIKTTLPLVGAPHLEQMPSFALARARATISTGERYRLDPVHHHARRKGHRFSMTVG